MLPFVRGVDLSGNDFKVSLGTADGPPNPPIRFLHARDSGRARPGPAPNRAPQVSVRRPRRRPRAGRAGARGVSEPRRGARGTPTGPLPGAWPRPAGRWPRSELLLPPPQPSLPSPVTSHAQAGP